MQGGGLTVVSKAQMSNYSDEQATTNLVSYRCERPEELIVVGQAVLGREMAHAMSIPEKKRMLVKIDLEDDCNSEL